MRRDRPLIVAIVALIASVPILVAVSAPAQAAPLRPVQLATTSGDVTTPSLTVAADTTPPKLSITRPPNESATNDSTPTISGTSDVISGTITVAIDDGPQVTVPTNATGGWTLISPELTDGQHFAVARAIDPGGTTETGPANFLVDTTPPGFSISTPINGSTTHDPTPTITGTFDSGIKPGLSRFGTITVTIDGGAPITFNNNRTKDGIVTGNWTLTPKAALGNGPHLIVARGVDFVGNSSTATTRFTITSAGPAGSPSLANSGSDPRPLLALALLMLLTGAVATRLGRTRR